ncbi:hypothetical protein D9M72_590190 [compost metagenome]
MAGNWPEMPAGVTPAGTTTGAGSTAKVRFTGAEAAPSTVWRTVTVWVPAASPAGSDALQAPSEAACTGTPSTVTVTAAPFTADPVIRRGTASCAKR